MIWGIQAYREDTWKTPIVQDSIALLIDTSLSMTAADVKPNRYNHALAIASWLILQHRAQYITIPFGAVPVVRTPVSYDQYGITQVVSQYTLWSYHVNDTYMWSAPWNAIGLAWSFLHGQTTPNKAIVLLGDGNTNTGYTIDTFIPYLRQDNIQLIICAIGQSWYVLWTNYADTPVISSLDVTRLDFITQQTNWKRRVCNNINESVERISMRLKENTVITTESIPHTISELRHNSTAQWAMILGILYLLITSLGTYIIYEKNSILYNKRKKS